MKAIVPANKILNGSRWRKWRMEIFIARRNISNLFFFSEHNNILPDSVFILNSKKLFLLQTFGRLLVFCDRALFFFSRLFLPCLPAYRHFLSVNKKNMHGVAVQKISNIRCWLLLFSTFSHRSSKYNEIKSLLVRKNVHCGNIDIYENISIELPVLEISFV